MPKFGPNKISDASPQSSVDLLRQSSFLTNHFLCASFTEFRFLFVGLYLQIWTLIVTTPTGYTSNALWLLINLEVPIRNAIHTIQVPIYLREAKRVKV